MKVINQRVEILDSISEEDMLAKLETAGRVCYKSEDKQKEGSSKKFIRNIIKSGHGSVIEHESITVKLTTNRAVANQIVRHRLASYSQESTRYCNYSKGRFRGEITVIKPEGIPNINAYAVWRQAMARSEINYFKLIEAGMKPEDARGVLPLDLKTELIVTANIRQLRHMIKIRTGKGAQPQTRNLFQELLIKLKLELPTLFEDL